MSLIDPKGAPTNRLIAALPRADRDRVLDACESTVLDLNATIYKPGDAIRHVYFPTASYISLLPPAGAAASIEIGLIGNEGMFGIMLLLGVTTSPALGLVQGAGNALRISAARFSAAARESAPFRQTLNRYLYVLTAQFLQATACHQFHAVDARLVRWLLMSQDRAHRDVYHLTHDLLAYALGIRRSGLTEAVGRLQAKRLIHYSRGVITVLDRPGLEAVACPCYEALKALYVMYIGNLRHGTVKLTKRHSHIPHFDAG
jgi:CRP-like cAMP-binding protein